MDYSSEKKIFVTSTEKSEDNKIMLASNYLKRNYVKKYDLRFTYLRFMLDTAPKLLLYQIHTIGNVGELMNNSQ